MSALVAASLFVAVCFLVDCIGSTVAIALSMNRYAESTDCSEANRRKFKRLSTTEKLRIAFAAYLMTMRKTDR